MTTRVPISPEQVGMDDVWEHYETMRAAIVRFVETAKRNLIGGVTPYNPTLFGKNLEELNAYSEHLLNEADRQACLFLIASAEASIRVDFLSRVYERRKDRVSRTFRTIHKHRGKSRVRLEEDILDTWSSRMAETKTTIGTFKGALQFRHWLAHGRYWVPKLGRRYDPSGIVQIIEDLFGAIGLSQYQ